MVSNIFRSKKDVAISNNEMSKTILYDCGEIIHNLYGKLQHGMKKFSIQIIAVKISVFKISTNLF